MLIATVYATQVVPSKGKMQGEAYGTPDSKSQHGPEVPCSCSSEVEGQRQR